MIELTITILRAIFTEKPTIEIVLISIGTFALLLALNIWLVKLWNKRKEKLANTPVSEQKDLGSKG